jgi:glycine/D-amino acid oxidase-like deaminating enzyme
VTTDKHAREARTNILWEHTSPPGPELSRFEGCERAAYAIIGGGIAGLSTAYHLAKAGRDVILLEAGEPGEGASGRSGGLIVPDLIRQTPAAVEHTMRAERGERLVRMIGLSAGFCFELIRRLNLQCESSQKGFWTPAHNPRVASSLHARAREWDERGFNVRYAETEETAEKLGSKRYCGALVLEDGGTVNPLAFTRGLAEAASRAGAKVYRKSPVTEVRFSGDRWRVSTAEGVLEAACIVLAANGGNAALHPSLRGTALPLDVIEYATPPLTEAAQALILRDDVSFTDKQPYIFTARFDAYRRLIAAFPNFALPRSRSTLMSEAVNRIRQHFPILNDVEIQYLWPGRAWINADLLPRIYELGSNAYAIQACNGRGIATNTLIGSELAAALVADDFSLTSILPKKPDPILAYPLTRHVPSLLMVLAHLRSRISRLPG